MYSIEKTVASVINNHYDYEKSRTRLIDEINVKFLYFVNETKTFIVEDYIESEWRDSYDLYYSKSSYNCTNTVKRIHFVKDDIDNYKDITEENYMGYINLRPIPVTTAVLSRIRLKCTGDAFDATMRGSEFYCLSMDTVVNFPHIGIRYKSFPLYSQDSMVAVCAHADIMMVSKYMYKKYNFNNYKLKDIVNNDTSTLTTFGRRVPSEGLTIYQMVKLLKANNYNPTAILFRNGNYDGKIDIIDYIDSFVESALPAIISFGGHVVIIIGHVHNNEKHYIIADDSSYHLCGTFKKRLSHIELVSEAELRSAFSATDVYIITPSFDRFYLQFPYLNLILNETKKIILHNYFKGFTGINLLSREILIESSRIKQFLSKCGDDSYDNILMPHYVWYIEFYLNEKELANLSFYMIINASAHKNDREYSIINNKDSLPVITAGVNMTNGIEQLSLLTSI